MSVKVEELTKMYGAQKAIDSVTFEAHKGEILGFLGPNGAGKTTTMKIITGFIPQSSGRASVCGFDVENASIEARRRIGYLPENNPLYKEMYVKEYLEFVAKLHQVSKVNQRVAAMIELTGLGKEQHKLIGALSKGYRQRVGLAQAMIHDPEVLVLDEPTTGLDPNQLVEIRNVIKELGKEKTLIFSTHIMQEVQAICTRVLIINNGKIVADDPIEALQARIKGESVVTVQFAESVKMALLLGIDGVRQVKDLGDKRWQLLAEVETDIQPAIFHFAVEHKLTLLEMKKEVVSVEEVFQKLTGKS
jgi:ABC-2 type transport system ATP-binding protein